MLNWRQTLKFYFYLIAGVPLQCHLSHVIPFQHQLVLFRSIMFRTLSTSWSSLVNIMFRAFSTSWCSLVNIMFRTFSTSWCSWVNVMFRTFSTSWCSLVNIMFRTFSTSWCSWVNVMFRTFSTSWCSLVNIMFRTFKLGLRELKHNTLTNTNTETDTDKKDTTPLAVQYEHLCIMISVVGVMCFVFRMIFACVKFVHT